MKVQEVRYYYLRWGETVESTCSREPYATVAVIINEDGTVTRGVAYCSMRDQFRKDVGRKRALARLMKTVEKQQDISMGSYQSQKSWSNYRDNPSSYDDFAKECIGFYQDKPTELEQKLFFSKK